MTRSLEFTQPNQRHPAVPVPPNVPWSPPWPTLLRAALISHRPRSVNSTQICAIPAPMRAPILPRRRCFERAQADHRDCWSTMQTSGYPSSASQSLALANSARARRRRMARSAGHRRRRRRTRAETKSLRLRGAAAQPRSPARSRPRAPSFA